MLDEDEELLDRIPDLDGNGKKDLLDLLFLDDLIREEEKENESDHKGNLDDDRIDDCEDGSEYGLDPEDFNSKEEYDEALEEAKYGWREYAEDGSGYGLNPDDFETETDYEEALEEAKIESSLFEAQTADKRIVNSSVSVYYKGITHRRMKAKQSLLDYKNGEYYGGEDELKSSKFIVESDSVAAQYLTERGSFLYAQAAKDHFELPLSIPDEEDYVKTSFETLLISLIKIDAKYAFKIWDWCLEKFLPYYEYSDEDNGLNHAILLDFSNFPDNFPELIVDHMAENESFIENLILKCTSTLFEIDSLVVTALRKNKITIAKKIMEYAFANEHSDVYDKIQFITSSIEKCTVSGKIFEKYEMLKQFKESIFPIVYTQTDPRIACEIDGWLSQIDEFIEMIEC